MVDGSTANESAPIGLRAGIGLWLVTAVVFLAVGAVTAIAPARRQDATAYSEPNSVRRPTEVIAVAKKTDKRAPAAEVVWADRPQEHDYPAAASYLRLLATGDVVDGLVERLRTGAADHFKAKDILRAARLPLLPTDNPHVATDLAKIRAGERLSPILLVRGYLAQGLRLQIADGYHRVCACYHTDENIDIPCVMVDL